MSTSAGLSVQVNPAGTRRKLVVRPAKGAFNRVRMRAAPRRGTSSSSKPLGRKPPKKKLAGASGGVNLRQALQEADAKSASSDDLGDLLNDSDIDDMNDADSDMSATSPRLTSHKKQKKNKNKKNKKNKGGSGDDDFDEDDLMALANTDRIVERGVKAQNDDENEEDSGTDASSDTDATSVCSGDSDDGSSDDDDDSDEDGSDDDDDSDEDGSDDDDDSDDYDERGTGARVGVPPLAAQHVYRTKEAKEYEKAKLVEQVARQMRQLGQDVDAAALERKSRRRLRLIKGRMSYQVRSQSAIQLYRRVMVLTAVMAEGLSKRYPKAFLNADLDNWSKQLYRDLAQFEPYLFDIYDEYGDRMEVNPIVNLAMAMVSHAGMVAYTNKQMQIGRDAAAEEISRSAAAFGTRDPRQAGPPQPPPPQQQTGPNGPTGTPRRRSQMPMSTPVPPPPGAQQTYVPRPRVHDDGTGLGGEGVNSAPVPSSQAGRRAAPMTRNDPRVRATSPPLPSDHSAMPPPPAPVAVSQVPAAVAPVQMRGPSHGADAAAMMRQFKARAEATRAAREAASTTGPAVAAAAGPPARRVKVTLSRRRQS